MASARSHIRSGQQALERGKVKPALLHFSRALAVDPNDADALAGIAKAFSMAGRPIDSLKALDRIVATGRATAATWLAMSEGLGSLGEWAQALGAAERAVALDPGSFPHGFPAIARIRRIASTTSVRCRIPSSPISSPPGGSTC